MDWTLNLSWECCAFTVTTASGQEQRKSKIMPNNLGREYFILYSYSFSRTFKLYNLSKQDTSKN